MCCLFVMGCVVGYCGVFELFCGLYVCFCVFVGCCVCIDICVCVCICMSGWFFDVLFVVGLVVVGWFELCVDY